MSPDDFQDLQEINDKLLECMHEALDEYSKEFKLSAILSLTLNSILEECDCLEDMIYCRNAFITIFNDTLRERNLI